jgi:hypothetical protein
VETMDDELGWCGCCENGKRTFSWGGWDDHEEERPCPQCGGQSSDLEVGVDLAQQALDWADFVSEPGVRDSFLAAADWELQRAMRLTQEGLR